jgi:hypothetical protein
MNEEEKEAITWFKQHIFDWTEFDIEERVDILIDLIEKQQTKITKLEEENEMLKGMFKKSIKE